MKRKMEYLSPDSDIIEIRMNIRLLIGSIEGGGGNEIYGDSSSIPFEPLDEIVIP